MKTASPKRRRSPPRISAVEKTAVRIMRKLYEATGGQPQRWESLGNLGATKADVAGIAYAIERHSRGDYPALLKLFSDSYRLPATYDAWLERAEGIERQFHEAGFGVARIWIRPVPFAAWCKERNVSPDQAARLTFVNAAAQERRSPR